MSDNNIFISLDEVKGVAVTLRNINTQLTDSLDAIKGQMSGLSATWTSEASETIKNKFNGLVPKFQDYKDVVEAYAKFLEITADAYDKTETAVNNNANLFK